MPRDQILCCQVDVGTVRCRGGGGGGSVAHAVSKPTSARNADYPGQRRVCVPAPNNIHRARRIIMRMHAFASTSVTTTAAAASSHSCWRTISPTAEKRKYNKNTHPPSWRANRGAGDTYCCLHNICAGKLECLSALAPRRVVPEERCKTEKKKKKTTHNTSTLYANMQPESAYLHNSHAATIQLF